MNPITSDKASSWKSSHPKKLITNTSKTTQLHRVLTIRQPVSKEDILEIVTVLTELNKLLRVVGFVHI